MLKSISNLAISDEPKLPTNNSSDLQESDICIGDWLEVDNRDDRYTLEARIISSEAAHSCRGCGQAFEYRRGLISNRSPYDNSCCYGCRKIFVLAKKADIGQRFSSTVNKYYKQEARFLRDWYLHQCTSSTSGREVYHLPLSTHYYRRSLNADSEVIFTYYSTLPNMNTVGHYSNCTGCTEFVNSKRKTLTHVTNRKNSGGYVATNEELFAFLVKSNLTCAFTGMQGSWVPFPAKMMGLLTKKFIRDHFVKNALFFLSLDHIVPLSGGGTSDVGNLQVTLQCLNNVKGSYTTEDFQSWFESFKQHQGYI